MCEKQPSESSFVFKGADWLAVTPRIPVTSRRTLFETCSDENEKEICFNKNNTPDLPLWWCSEFFFFATFLGMRIMLGIVRNC